MVLAMLCLVSYAGAADMEKIKQRGTIEFAVYAKFPPFSAKTAGQPEGVDIEIGRALAEKLGFTPIFRLFLADESVEDDFRNQIWKGHYLGGGTADVMMHAPVDSDFARRNDQVQIFAPYFEEEIVVARGLRLKEARNLDAFLDAGVGVEQLTLSSYFLLSAFGGGMRESAVHFKSVSNAVEALRQGEVAAVLGPRGEIEGALGKDINKFHMGPMPMPGLHRTRWDLGLAVKSGHDELAAALASAMSELRDDGTIAQIFNRSGLTYRSPSVTEVPIVGRQASIRAESYSGPACH
jgi:ABC-type amino acid transport substrate-binding protein